MFGYAGRLQLRQASACYLMVMEDLQKRKMTTLEESKDNIYAPNQLTTIYSP